jgi:predicted RNA-binding protein associated with RNAse of E/G family
MTNQPFFQPGQTILLREIWRGKVLEARPEIIVQDSPELMALYLAPGTIFKQAFNKNGKEATLQNIAASDWTLKNVTWGNLHKLRLTIPGAGYSVLLFWKHWDMSHQLWYINMESSLRRTSMGFDSTDRFLDIIIEPDLSSWHWKDEEELAGAIALGLSSKEKAAAMHVEGEKVARWIQSGKSLFNGWEKWRPDPAWQVPVLPAGWDKV